MLKGVVGCTFGAVLRPAHAEQLLMQVDVDETGVDVEKTEVKTEDDDDEEEVGADVDEMAQLEDADGSDFLEGGLADGSVAGAWTKNQCFVVNKHFRSSKQIGHAKTERAHQCRERCLENKACMGWQWNSKNKECQLKAAIQMDQMDKKSLWLGDSAGWVAGSASRECQEWDGCVQPRYVLTGGPAWFDATKYQNYITGKPSHCWKNNCKNTDSLKVGNMGECSALCRAVKHCAMWTYHPKHSKCWLRQEKGYYNHPHGGFITGKKNCNTRCGGPKSCE